MKTLLSWAMGLTAVVVIIVCFRPEDFGGTLIALGLSGLVIWVVPTLVARWLLVETTILPLGILGYTMARSDVFWLGWIRTLANQVLPLSGVAAYAKVVRDRAGIPWAELATLAAPQFVLAIAALGFVGLLAVASNVDLLQARALLLGALYLGILLVAVAVTSGAAWFIRLLPATLSSRAGATAVAFGRLARHPGFVLRVTLLHAAAILLRGGRIWILFAAAGVSLDWPELLLLVAIAESTMLVNVTPGGLGIREVLVMGGSALLGVPPPVAASVALADRMFVITLTALLSAPAVAYLRAAGERDQRLK